MRRAHTMVRGETMPETYPYNRQHAYEYAMRWALAQNPLFYHFAGIGGDCTNFISQCVLAGSGVMNDTKTFGWYYYALSSRSPSWTGVQYFYNFITENRGVGPFASIVDRDGVALGDVVQLGHSDGTFYHTLLVTGRTARELYVCAHSFDAKNRALSSYQYDAARFLHIEGVRAEPWQKPFRFDRLLAGSGLTV